VINKSARFSAPVLHLWHKENDRSHLEENKRRLQQVLNATHIRALKGVDQYRENDNPLPREATVAPSIPGGKVGMREDS